MWNVTFPPQTKVCRWAQIYAGQLYCMCDGNKLGTFHSSQCVDVSKDSINPFTKNVLSSVRTELSTNSWSSDSTVPFLLCSVQRQTPWWAQPVGWQRNSHLQATVVSWHGVLGNSHHEYSSRAASGREGEEENRSWRKDKTNLSHHEDSNRVSCCITSCVSSFGFSSITVIVSILAFISILCMSDN